MTDPNIPLNIKKTCSVVFVLLACEGLFYITMYYFQFISVFYLGVHVAIEQVAQLSEFTSPELKDIILSVVHGLLATLSPKMHSKPSTSSENATVGKTNAGNEDCAEVVENSSLQFQPFISLTRDYLARLLFWSVILFVFDYNFVSIYVICLLLAQQLNV